MLVPLKLLLWVLNLGDMIVFSMMHKDDDSVIVGRNGGVEPNNFVYHYYSEFLNSAGVKYRPFSAARNTFAKNCVESGVSAEELSKLLGKSNAEYTRKKYYLNID